jgi:TonB family protein
VVETAVISASDPAFGEAAAEAVRQWKFKPGQINGRAVNTRVAQQFPFNLSESNNPWKPIGMTPLKGKKPGDLPAAFDWDKPPIIANNTREETVYPFEALRQGKTGRAVVRFVIGVDGRVQSMAVHEATAPEFGQSALAVINMTYFVPAEKKDGKRTMALVEAKFDFLPNGNGDAPVRSEARGILRDLEKHPEKIVSAVALDHPLKPLFRAAPVYPKTLEQSGSSGEATVEIFVDRDGHAQLPRIISSTAPEFGYSAAQAVNSWGSSRREKRVKRWLREFRCRLFSMCRSRKTRKIQPSWSQRNPAK